MSVQCPICDSLLGNSPTAWGDYSEYNCKRCGKFQITGSAEFELPALLKDDPNRIAALSYAVQQIQRTQGLAKVDSAFLKKLLETRLPSSQGQANNLVLWVGDNVIAPGETVEVSPASHMGIVGATTPKGFDQVLRHLFDNELVEGHLSRSIGILGQGAITLSFSGRELYEN